MRRQRQVFVQKQNAVDIMIPGSVNNTHGLRRQASLELLITSPVLSPRRQSAKQAVKSTQPPPVLLLAEDESWSNSVVELTPDDDTWSSHFVNLGELLESTGVWRPGIFKFNGPQHSPSPLKWVDRGMRISKAIYMLAIKISCLLAIDRPVFRPRADWFDGQVDDFGV